MPNLKKTIKTNRNQKYLAMASMSALLVACGTSATTGAGNVSGDVTTGNDNVTLGAAGGVGIVDLLAGDDIVVGGDLADFIRGGAGADNIQGGGGVDNIVVIGTSSNGTYTLSDIQNPNGTGIDLSVLINLAAVNDNAVSDVQAGEVIDGGADGAHLFVYGDVDFTTSTLKNITRIDVQSTIKFTATQLKDLIDNGGLKTLLGDGTSTFEITNDGGAVVIDFSKVDMQNVKQIILGSDVTLLLDQADLSGVQTIEGAGTIKAVTGDLDVSGIAVDSGIDVATASTPTPTPTSTPGATPTPAGNSITLNAAGAKVSISEKSSASDYATTLDDTITSTKANAEGSTIDGAGGTDTLYITTDSEGDVGLSDKAGGHDLNMMLTDVETIVFQNTSDTITLKTHNGENIRIEGADGALENSDAHTSQNGQTITVNNIDGNVRSFVYLSDHTGLVVKLGASIDKVLGVQTADAHIFMGSGNDQVSISSHSDGFGSVGVNANAVLNAAALEGATIDGGDGDDYLYYYTDANAAQSTVTLSSKITNFERFSLHDAGAGYTTTFVLGNLGFETIEIGSNGAYTSAQDSVFNIDAGDLEVNGFTGTNQTVNFTTEGTFTLDIGAAWDVVNLFDGTNNVSISKGDLANFSETAGRAFVGGNTANDTITLTNAITKYTLGQAEGKGVSGVENIILSAGGSIQTVNTNVASGATLTVTNISTSKLIFNGAAETDGNFVINNSASSATSTLTGGAGADTITGGTGVDTMTGGGGADTFIIATTDLNTNVIVVTDIIVGFTSGVDKIDTSGAAGSVSGTINYVEVAGAANLEDLVVAAVAALTDDVKYYVGETGGNAYLVTDYDGNGYTDVIQFTGLDLDDISYSDII